MKKIAFCGASGNGISPLEQIMIKKGYREVIYVDRIEQVIEEVFERSILQKAGEILRA